MTRVVEGDRRRTRAQQVLSDAKETAESTRPGNSRAVSEYILTFLVPLVDSYENTLGERDYLILACLSRMLRQNLTDPLIALAMLVHLACLKNLSLAQRRIAVVSILDEESERRLKQFLTKFAQLAAGLLDNAKWGKFIEENNIECDLEDLIDGRLLSNVLYSLQRGGAGPLDQPDISKDFEYLLRALQSLSKTELGLEQPLSLRTGERSMSMEVSPYIDSKVLPFSSPIFDKHLKSIHISIDELASNDHEQFVPTISREISHWHNRRPLDRKKASVTDKPLTKWYNPLRANQKYMAEMTAYAASLTNSKGKTLTPEIMTLSAIKGTSGPSSGRDQKPKEQKIKDVKPKDAKGKKDSKPSKADQIIADNKAKRDNVDRSRALSGWEEVRKRLEKLEPEIKYLEAVSYYNRLDDSKARILRLEVDIYRLHALLYRWAALCKQGKKDEGYGIVALIWDIIRSLNSSRAEMTKVAAAYLESVSLLIGLPKPEAHSDVLDRPMSFQLLFPQASSGTLSINMSPLEFQLMFCGPYMDRNTDARPDSRVALFEPDGWQREVLDELDANHSIFVVAPTSAGKTFISFYAMQRVLRESNEGILVYVAPTKALVNQVCNFPHASH